MRNYKLFFCFWTMIFSMVLLFSQENEARPNIPALLKAHNKMTVPYISVQTLKMDYKDYTILDTRKWEEYKVSHLPQARWVGEKYDLINFPKLDKNAKIVVYCSVGIRSEDYGERLLKDGYTEVYNLYGSIFYWKDAGYEVVDSNSEITNKVHVFSKPWAKYLKTGEHVF